MTNLWDKNWQKKTALDIHPELVALIIKHAPGKEILEIGFGTGGDLLSLSNLGFHCHGLEMSRVAYNNAMNNKKIKVYLGDGQKSPFVSSRFDLVFHQGLMEHFKDPRALLGDHRRILKTNGVMVIDVPHKWNLFTVYKNFKQFLGSWYGGWERSYSANELVNAVERMGFKTIKIAYRGIWPHRWGKFLFPGKIIKRKWVGKLITTFPISMVRDLAKKIYNSSRLVKLVSYQNVIIVAQKI